MTVPLAPGFHLHRSNRTEQLLARLVDVVSRPASDDPLASECIVVQGQGMGRWLSMSLSEQLGVWARPAFPFLRRLLDDCADRVLGASPAPSFFEPDTQILAIADLLEAFADDPDFAPVSGYLGEDPGGRRRVQLAERVAQTFDLYTVHRPDLLAGWGEGGSSGPGGVEHRDARWQARLWRALAERAAGPPPEVRWRRLAEALRTGAPALGGLPPRISIFGLSSIPPVAIDVLDALARHVPVHLFVLSPTREFWADLKTKKALWREGIASGGALVRSEAEADVLEGHPLLASFGRLGRDFQTVLESQVDYDEGEDDLFVDPETDPETDPDPETERSAVLGRLQAHMLRLESPHPTDVGEISAARDDSVRVHVTHSPLREIEVLNDQLLHLFEADPTLEPKDVIVMSPDIERHAPLIEAVFAARNAGSAPRIPHRIADRSIVVTREGVAAFLRLLELAEGRCGASEVLDVLALESVRERYGLSAADVTRLEAWIVAAGVRWGIDGAHRVDEGLPDDDTHTWRFGLDRLLLGAAMDPRGDELWAERRPLADLEGDDLRAVGALARFVEDLAWARARLLETRPLSAWRSVFAELVDRCIVRSDDNAHHHQVLRDCFTSLAERSEVAGFDGAIGLAAARHLALRTLRASTPAYGFLSGGVTFCEMVPMRSIPFRVVCLIGLDDGTFPRVRRPLGFDLSALQPRVGDRSPRDDDRALFLEAILSARDKLLLSYVGRDIHDNESRPPSIVVSELLDVLAREVGTKVDDLGPAGWVVEHPLKSFSPSYFDPGRPPGLFSFDAVGLAGARALAAPPRAPTPFLSPSLSIERTADVDVLELSTLARTLRRAARSVLREALEIRVDEGETPERDREPSDLRGLARWSLGDAVLRRSIAGDPPDEAYFDVCVAEGRLPPGELGRALYNEVAGEALELASLVDDEAAREVDLDLEIAGVRLVGRLGGVHAGGRVRATFSRLGGSGDLEAWVEHLALCASGVAGEAPTTRLVGRPERRGKSPETVFEPVADAPERLADLIDIARHLEHEALPIFAKTSRKYVSRLRSGQADDEEKERLATLDAYEAWRGRSEGIGDDRGELNEDAELRYLWRATDPLKRPSGAGAEARYAFRALAQRIFGPMLDAMREGA